MEELHEMFAKMDYKSQDTSLKYKLSTLGIGDDRKQELINISFQYCNIPSNYQEQDVKTTVETIKLDKLKGWDRADVIGKDNWLECLDGLHKQKNLNYIKINSSFKNS